MQTMLSILEEIKQEKEEKHLYSRLLCAALDNDKIRHYAEMIILKNEIIRLLEIKLKNPYSDEKTN